jgi:tRNA pseudouridine38-40 synthase
MQRWKLTIEYRGTGYSGWQRQESGVLSVQQAVEDAIDAFCQRRITIHVAGRTDAGVHARGQVAHFDLDYGGRPLSGHDLAKALNAHLRPQPIAIVSAEAVEPDFHARFDALNKLYLYRIINRNAPPALDDGLAWHVRRTLDVGAMQEAAQHLLGKHDFTTFRDSECQAKSPEKTIDRLDFDIAPYDAHGGREIRLYAEARSFLHHQVRNMIGTLEQVGEGKWTPADVKTALQARDRTKGGPTAPPDGLYLMRVDYAAAERGGP